MRLIVCCLCTGEEPFVCPFKFRRSYMLVHLEKAHELPVKNLEFVRRIEPDDHRVVWMTVLNGNARRTLFEVEVDLDGRADRSNEQVVESDRETNGKQSSWTPAALQSLYRERGGRQPA